MEIFTELGIEFLTRYGHIISGITWIGLLYYFNFVQTPSFAAFDAGARNEATAKLVPRAMWWFRWGAMATLAFGLLLFVLYSTGDLKPYDEMDGPNVVGIVTGIFFAVIMFSNVWFVIWPAQKRAIANAENVLAGREADPGLAPIARRSACASRTNTFLSIPMLFFMVAAAHFLGGEWDTSSGGDRALWYIIVLVIGAVLEINALRAPAAGRPESWYFDSHRNTIIGGFVLLVILYLLMEILFG
jgi:uncharacterized membrane protein